MQYTHDVHCLIAPLTQSEKARLSIILEDEEEEEEENEYAKDVTGSSLALDIKQEKEIIEPPGEVREAVEKEGNVTVEAIIEVHLSSQQIYVGGWLTALVI